MRPPSVRSNASKVANYRCLNSAGTSAVWSDTVLSGAPLRSVGSHDVPRGDVLLQEVFPVRGGQRPSDVRWAGDPERLRHCQRE